jgi:hypothetical protein
MRVYNPEDIPLAGGVGEAGEGSGGGQVDAGGSQAPARRGGEVSHSLGDSDPKPDPQDPNVFGPPGSGSISQRYESAPKCQGSSQILLRFLHQKSKRPYQTNISPLK